MFRFIFLCSAIVLICAAGSVDGDDKTKKAQKKAAVQQFQNITAEQLIKRFDKDNDNKLDAEELGRMLQALRNRPGLDAKTKPKNKADAAGPLAGMLERLDENKDGKISRAEAKGPLAENFDRVDTNKDGALDRQELQIVMERLQERAKAAGKARPAPGGAPAPDFDALDLDADGRLSKDELERTRFAGQLLNIDGNKDGKIERKEFENFVKKEAEKHTK